MLDRSREMLSVLLCEGMTNLGCGVELLRELLLRCCWCGRHFCKEEEEPVLCTSGA